LFVMTAEHAVATPAPDAGGLAGCGAAIAGAAKSTGDNRIVLMMMVRLIGISLIRLRGI
jgi:hypothetical protein